MKPLQLILLVCIHAATVQGQYFSASLKKTIFDLPIPGQCSSGKSTKYLAATKDTVSWGFWYQGTKPSATVKSGDQITVEMLTHQAADAYDLMIKGDKAMEEIFKWDSSGMTVPVRGPGKHILTGPIYVCDAEPGDTLRVEILDLYPRVNPTTGKTYGSNEAASWGYQYRFPFRDGKPPAESVTIYELVKSPKDDTIMYVAPRYQFPFKTNGKGPVTACQPQDKASRTLPRTYPGYGYTHSDNSDYVYGAFGKIPCVDGKQEWPAIVLGGTPNNKSLSELTPLKTKTRVPVQLHIGNIGVAQDIDVPYTSTTPSDTGNNMDIRYLGKGSTLYLPVKVPGALLQMGDCHASQGNSEYDGTAIETSITGKFKITVIKKGKEPAIVPAKHGLNFPLVENKDRYFVVSYAYNDYISELLGKTVYPSRVPANYSGEPITAIGPIKNPMTNIGLLGADLNKAMTTCARNTRDWLMGVFDVNEDTANSLMTTGVDFEVTQVVDQNWGIHASIPKFIFNGDNSGKKHDPFIPTTLTGTSLTATCTPKEWYKYK